MDFLLAIAVLIVLLFFFHSLVEVIIFLVAFGLAMWVINGARSRRL